MYLVALKTMLVQALRQTFDADYPYGVVNDFRNTFVSIEYPVDPQKYPSIWVDYDDDEPLRRAGIDHIEMDSLSDPLGSQPHTRWEFKGTVSLTVVALTSLQRDTLYDEMIRVIAFGNEDAGTAQFRSYVENNGLIGANIDFDTIGATGNNAAPGTPWDTDEIIYERGIRLNIVGEFVADRATGTLVPLSKILVTPALDLNEERVALPLPDDNSGWV